METPKNINNIYKDSLSVIKENTRYVLNGFNPQFSDTEIPDEEMEIGKAYFTEQEVSEEHEIPKATETQEGIIQLATVDEIKQGTNNTKAITPKNLKDVLSSGSEEEINFSPNASTTQKGIVRLATEEEINEGTRNDLSISPLNLNKYIDKNFAHFIKPDLTLHINQLTGNDSIADGSEEKPFKTYEKCLYYIRKFNLNYYEPNNVVLNINIVFDSDYQTENDTYVYSPTTPNNTSTIIITGTGHNVVLPSTAFENCRAYLKDLTFKGTHASYALSVSKGAVVNINNITLEQTEKSIELLLVNYTGELDLVSNTYLKLKLNESFTNIKYLINTYLNGYFRGSTNNTITIESTTNCIAFFNCVSQGFTYIPNIIFNYSEKLNCKKYAIDTLGQIYTGGKGEDYIPANLEGTVKNGGQYI